MKIAETAAPTFALERDDALTSTPQDYFVLLKPRVMSLVVFTAIIGASLAPGSLHPFLLSVAILSIALGAGASGALNMWCDRDIDLLMERTRNRPIPAGRIAPNDALSLGIILSAGSILTLTVATNYLAGFLLTLTIAFYVIIYTLWLKRWTAYNIVIGGAAGAFPPLIGWAAVTNSIGGEALILFALIFLWTPPHFWALALHCAKDYERAGIPMLPNVKGIHETKKQIVFYSILLVGASALPFVTGMSGLFYGMAAFILGSGLAHYVWRLWNEPGNHGAMPLFRYSLLYLFLLFMALWIDPWLKGMVSL